MSDESVDPLRQLFQHELREQSDLLRDSVNVLRTAPRQKDAMEQARGAVHTIRGAARIVKHAGVAGAAEVLEGLLAQALAGQRGLAPADLDHCTRIADQLTLLAQADPALPFVDPRPLAAPAPQPSAHDHAPPRAAASAAGAGPINPAMVELFREEARSHCATLTAGLLELERTPTSSKAIEPLMRAAHSLKGAARIVGLDAAVRLAHVMEDAFVAAQSGRIPIEADDVDVLLRGADLLATLGDADLSAWASQHGGAAEAVGGAIAAIARGEHAAPPPGHERQPSPEPGSANAPAPGDGPPPADADATETAPAEAAPKAPPAAARPAEAGDAVVRVTAQSLDRLMSLAGESLVQSRWLEPFAGALLQLQKKQDHLTQLLDQLAGVHPGSSQFEEKLAQARRAAAHNRCQIAERRGEFEDHAGAAADLNSRLYREVIVSRMRPFADGAHAFPRLVRDTARRVGKQARLEILGQQTEVDRDILEKLEAPLTHLLRNAIDHGLETPGERTARGKPAEGTIRIEARHRAGMLSISVSDDGAGIDVERIRRKVVERRQADAAMAARLTEAELLEFLFLPGFSTAAALSEVSGRGVGLDVVQDMVRRVGGSVQITSHLGRGAAFHLALPITLSVLRAVLVDIGGEPYAFPHNRIDRLLRVRREDLHSLEHRQFITVDDRPIGLVVGSQLLDLPAGPQGDDIPVLLLSDQTGAYGLIVEAVRGEQDLVVRPLDPRLGKVANVSAAAVLDDGEPVLIADVEDMIRAMGEFIQAGTLRRCERAAAAPAARKRVLVVDDSITVREVQRQILRLHGYDVDVAVDGQDGWNKVRAAPFDLVVSDIDMPRMTGLDFVRRIREDQLLRDLPVIIVSYKDRDEDRLRGMQAGANHYLTKSSFHDDTFVQAVADLIGRA